MALDNFRTIELIWDKANKSIIKTIKTASSDTTGLYFSVKILDGGQEVTLNNAKLQLYWEHPNFNTSGTDDFNTVNNGGLFKMTFSEEMLTNIGELNAHLVLTLPDGKITSNGFPIEVFKGTNGGVVVPSNGDSTLVVALENALDKIKIIEDGAEVVVIEENSVGTENIKNKAVTTSKISDGSVTIHKTDFITENEDFSGINKLNPSNSTEGGYYDHSTLNWVASSAFSQSEFIPCESGDVIGFSEMQSTGGGLVGSFVVFKNSEGEIFSGFNRFGNNLNVTVPNDAASFSTNYRNQYADTLMVTVNEPVPDLYVPYGTLAFTDERLLRSISEYVLSQTSSSIYKSRFKSVNFIGDSITWGYSPYDGSKLPTIWPDLVADALGIDTVRNYGISGSTLGSLPDEPRNPMVNRFADYPEADLTVVLGGRNDWNFGVPLGTIEDNTKFTYYGALNIMMDGLITKSPNSAIVFLTPLHGSDSTNHATKGDIIDYRNAVIEVGAKHSIPVYDLYGMSGIYPENSTSMTALMPDGRHPNVAGHEKISHGITGFLKNI